MTYPSDKADYITKLPPWVMPHCDSLAALLDKSQAPQALLIHGAPGTGRRYVGYWYASRLLGIPEGRLAGLAEVDPDSTETQPELGHPDLLVVTSPPEKTAIPVASVRTVTDFLHLRSHQGGARVALIYPADAMTQSAANSLLKILEEPPAGSAIILIATSSAALLPTVVSRCHRLRLSTPPRETSRPWLETEDGAANWDLLLDFSGGAPLRAKALHNAGFAARATSYAEDLKRLRQRRETAVAIAKKWAAADTEPLLRWLYLQAANSVAGAAREVPEKPLGDVGNRPLQSPRKPRNIRALIERVHDIEELYRNRSRSMNLETQFTSILQRWYGDAGGDQG